MAVEQREAFLVRQLAGEDDLGGGGGYLILASFFFVFDQVTFGR